MTANRDKPASSSMEWSKNHDLILCTEILVLEPFKFPKRSKERGDIWGEVCANLNTLSEPRFKVTKRSVRDRFTLLQTKHKEKVRFEEGASGINCEETELDKAIAEIIEKEMESEKERNEKAGTPTKKNEQEKASAEERRYKMIKVLIIHFLIGSAIGNKIIIPILHMPIFNIQPFTGSWENLNPQELIKKFTASHLVELEPATYNIDKLYVTHIRPIGNMLSGKYINIASPRAASTLSDINYYWSTTIPEIDIKGTELEGVKVQDHSFGEIQELMLINITNKMSIDLSKVALRLGLSVRNLSYSYDPAKWENVVHAMIEEGMQNYQVYLEIASVDKLASLFRLTAIQLKNSTIDDFVSLLPPILPKKVLMDTNITRDILVFLGLAANSSEAILYNMAQRTTNLTVEQFGVLYNLTKEQQRVNRKKYFAADVPSL
ncbi:hypothetical protein QZH41_002227 [Actinostola sp. cb2023]|nr:hypothetical protein QZH41_002227 [Actinostola sp. cb2023]